MVYRDKNLLFFAKQLRLQATRAERILWCKIRNKQILNTRFYWQAVLGNYIVDFCAYHPKLILEIDGSQHLERYRSKQDTRRTLYLHRQGFKVMRFTNVEVMQTCTAVLDAIYHTLRNCT